MAKIERALISVSDKSGLIDFCRELHAMGVELISTGGTARQLQEHAIPVKEVSELTGFPEMLDGRVKTLHPKVHGGLLGLREEASHRRQMDENGIVPIDLVVVNLYPFEATVAKENCLLEEAIENIDIGGPAMLRSAAKNYRSVTVITDPADYNQVIDEMKGNQGETTSEFRSQLARKVYARTAAYDAAISNWLSSLDEENKPSRLPETLTLQVHKSSEMRYGENPHQSAAFYIESALAEEPSVANAKQHQGKALSFNNIHDANGAFELVKEFDDSAAVVVKHTNPCGAALDADPLTAYRKARDTDPVSAFGGIIAFNQAINADVAEEITQTFVEAVIAPGYSEEALKVFSAKKNLRILETPAFKRGGKPSGLPFDLKRVNSGLLLQQPDTHILQQQDLKVVTQRQPSEAEMRDLLFAWRVVKHVKSNAIVYAKDLCTVGVGAGQMSRVDSSRIAVWKAKEAAENAKQEGNPVEGSVLASDAFFPFADGVEAAAKAGAKAVIQPGGSIRDDEVIKAADAHGLAMVFTGVRHFKH
ncbi:bifunctional phosphoribosylaminoimidazolecarboxamide formyltransferase/IMP cyclohydrolase [Magnetococcales bacterium HHB-1]